jgi:hypothetical protein
MCISRRVVKSKLVSDGKDAMEEANDMFVTAPTKACEILPFALPPVGQRLQ